MLDFASVVFAGGGCRCFWQAGFWHVLGAQLQPRVISAVSAGSAFAAAAIAGKLEVVLDAFKRRTAANPSNLHLQNLRGPQPVFPHYAMYRGTILEITDDAMLQALREGPTLRVLIGHPPARVPAALAAVAGMAAYQLEKTIHGRFEPQWPKAMGFHASVVRANDCPDANALADLILHSSCVPPLMPLMSREGISVLDGALLHPIPLRLVEDDAPTLVLLNQHGDHPAPRPGVTYVGPSAPVPVELWDYAHPKRIQAAWDLGVKDGEAFARRCSQAVRLGA